MARREHGPFAREDARERTRRDVQRRRRRAQGPPYWRSLALIGSVGWPIVLLATGGAALGRYLDVRWGTGVQFSLILLFLGITAGTAMAYHALKEGEP